MEVEGLARVDLDSPDAFDQLGQEAPDESQPAEHPDVRIERLRAAEVHAVTRGGPPDDTDDTDRAEPSGAQHVAG